LIYEDFMVECIVLEGGEEVGTFDLPVDQLSGGSVLILCDDIEVEIQSVTPLDDSGSDFEVEIRYV
jgi:hypothetical protein